MEQQREFTYATVDRHDGDHLFDLSIHVIVVSRNKNIKVAITPA